MTPATPKLIPLPEDPDDELEDELSPSASLEVELQVPVVFPQA